MLKSHKKYKHKVRQNIYAVTDGKVKSLDEIDDNIFSNRVMGEGFALSPQSDMIYSPASGTVSMLFPTKHAIGLTLDNGLELLINLGIETVELVGEPFELFVHDGDHIEAGALIAKMDRQYITSHHKSTDCVVVCTNGQKLDEFIIEDVDEVQAKDVIGNILNK